VFENSFYKFIITLPANSSLHADACRFWVDNELTEFSLREQKRRGAQKIKCTYINANTKPKTRQLCSKYMVVYICETVDNAEMVY